MHDFGVCLKQRGSANQKGADKKGAQTPGLDPFFFFDNIGLSRGFSSRGIPIRCCLFKNGEFRTETSLTDFNRGNKK